MRRLGLRRSELEHAVRLQNGNAIGQVDYGRLEPGGQLVLTLKHIEQAATKADVAELIDRLPGRGNTDNPPVTRAVAVSVRRALADKSLTLGLPGG